MPLIARKFKDLNLAMTIHPVTGDISKLTDEDAIKASLKLLILTKHYERPFHSEIGCNVGAMLFNLANPITAANIKQSILTCVANFEPRVNVTNVTVVPHNSLSSYDVTVEFFIVNLPSPFTLDVVLERLR